MTVQTQATFEPIFKKSPQEHRVFVRGKRNQTTSNITGRQVAKLVAQPAGTAAVVCHGDHSRDIGCVTSQTGQNRIDAGSTPDRNYPGFRMWFAHLEVYPLAKVVPQCTAPGVGSPPRPDALFLGFEREHSFAGVIETLHLLKTCCLCQRAEFWLVQHVFPGLGAAYCCGCST